MPNEYISPRSIEHLVDVITGGSGWDDAKPIGIYRSGAKIESFMRKCNERFALDGSRISSVTEHLIRLNRLNDGQKRLRDIIERVASIDECNADTELQDKVIHHLNTSLKGDGIEVMLHARKAILVESGVASGSISDLEEISRTLDFDTVSRDLNRALKSCDEDPEDAITAACSAIESVCRSILIELGAPLPKKKDIMSLYAAVKEPLGLSAGRSDIPDNIANDVRSVLSGLNTSIQGIGSLRTHSGDAHGREKGFSRIDSRIARLAINSASAAALFLIETWQRKYPERKLQEHTGYTQT